LGDGTIKFYENFVNDFCIKANNLLISLEITILEDSMKFIKMIFTKYQLGMTIIAGEIPQIYYGSEIGMKSWNKERRCSHSSRFTIGWRADTNNADSGRTTAQNNISFFF
jgi:hypothetical protein